MRNFFWRKRQTGPTGPRQNQWKDPLGESAMKEASRVRGERRDRFAHWVEAMTGAVCGIGLVLIGTIYSGPVLKQLFDIRVISVDGLHRLDKQQVLELAQVKSETLLHQIDTKAVRERIEGHPWIKAADVTRILFHELRISIRERKPAVIVRTEGQNFLCDDDGRVLTRLGQLDDDTLPLVTGVDLHGLLQGTETVRHAVVSGVEVARVVGQSFDGRLQVLADNPSNLVALVQGVRFQFGDEALKEQWERFRRVRPTLKPKNVDGQGHGVSEVDLRYENRIIVREGG